MAETLDKDIVVESANGKTLPPKKLKETIAGHGVTSQEFWNARDKARSIIDKSKRAAREAERNHRELEKLGPVSKRPRVVRGSRPNRILRVVLEVGQSCCPGRRIGGPGLTGGKRRARRKWRFSEAVRTFPSIGGRGGHGCARRRRCERGGAVQKAGARTSRSASDCLAA